MTVQLPDAPNNPRRCDFCDAHVTAEFRRTYGTYNRRAKRCPKCDSWARIHRGSARGHDVDRPDPQENPGYSGGRKLRTPADVATDGGESA